MTLFHHVHHDQPGSNEQPPIIPGEPADQPTPAQDELVDNNQVHGFVPADRPEVSNDTTDHGRNTRTGRAILAGGVAALAAVGYFGGAVVAKSGSHSAPVAAASTANLGHSPKPTNSSKPGQASSTTEAQPTSQSPYGITTAAAAELFGWDISTDSAEPGSDTTVEDMAVLDSKVDSMSENGLLNYMTLKDPSKVNPKMLYEGYKKADQLSLNKNDPSIMASIGINIAPSTDLEPLDPSASFTDMGNKLREAEAGYIKDNSDTFGSFTPSPQPFSKGSYIEGQNGKKIPLGGDLLNDGTEIIRNDDGTIKAVRTTIVNAYRFSNQVDTWVAVPFKDALSGKSETVMLLYSSLPVASP